MRTFRCLCDNPLFFDNSFCLRCSRDVGFCPVCRLLVPLLPTATNSFSCGNPTCAAPLVKCYNYVTYNICNWCVSGAGQDASSSGAAPLCERCRLTRTIPDLSVPGNREKWYRLEVAKRRLLYDLDLLQLPYSNEIHGVWPPLYFDFKADIMLANEHWQSIGIKEEVYTGHVNGVITINIREADDVERERLRVAFGEAQRTLLGHFRHEIGHYYWEVLVKYQRDVAFAQIFGDPLNPSYQDAANRYYNAPPPNHWQSHFVSAYATMHPWEDFAETFAVYVDIVSLLDTAYHVNIAREQLPLHDLEAMVTRYQELGVALNELNRSKGTMDVAPEVVSPGVKEKLRFIHGLMRRS
ncbi:MAG: hypothetical protein FJ147_01670 [Deltaproteobacteria bacterium]|nr:hypothetical protein [Deltaproteobacteria bacterium]